MHRTLKALFLVTPLALGAQQTDATYQKALAYFEQRNYDACLTAIRPAIKESDENTDARVLAAHCHAGKKNYADAVAHLRAVAEEAPERTDIKEDIVALLIEQGKFRDARRAGYRFSEELKDSEKPVPASLTLLVARAELGYGKPQNALTLARDVKKSDDATVKYGGLITETRALIALGNFSEADIALSFAESMRESDLHPLLRAMIEESKWIQQKYPKDQRAQIVAAYEKLARSEDATIRAAVQKNIERVKAAKAN
ncbi:MAG TPA: CDC27 family protein [Turneriella sp.]|nr:CDC27 family protein [Turneriella sp.]HNM99987.1 CDC27 family protein [Turneriella sp.]